MVTTRAEAQAATRNRLLDVAHQEFSQRRVSDVSLDDIARLAGFTKGAVYSNFSSKADLLLSVLERRMRERGADYVDLVDSVADGDLGDAAGGRANNTLENDLGYFRLVAAVWAEAVHDPELGDRFAAIRREHRRRLAGSIERRADEVGVVLTVDAEHLATGLIGMSMSAMFDALIDPTIDVGAIHRTMTEAVLAGVIATSPTR